VIATIPERPLKILDILTFPGHPSVLCRPILFFHLGRRSHGVGDFYPIATGTKSQTGTRWKFGPSGQTAPVSLYLEENLKVREKQASGTTTLLEHEAEELREQINELHNEIGDLKKAVERGKGVRGFERYDGVVEQAEQGMKKIQRSPGEANGSMIETEYGSG